MKYTALGDCQQGMVNSSDLFVLINDLQPNTEYAFSTKVIKGRHQSKWSESVLSKTSGAAEENGTIWKSYACVAVSCGYGTYFAVRTCDELYHTQKSAKSTLALKLSVSPPYYPWVTATTCKWPISDWQSYGEHVSLSNYGRTFLRALINQNRTIRKL